MSIEKIIVGAGCFWGVESTFSRIPGVVNTTCGYCGGNAPHPSYEMVCTGETGHAEVVLVEYDTSVIPLNALLEAFWQCHDPTTKDRQGVDVGSQYRSAIYFFTEDQEKSARLSRDAAQQSGRWKAPIVTEIQHAAPFYPAEDYHQRYFEKKGIG
ncbi:peptide-methionine (S)-S-oxide reductase [Nitrosomonas sp. Nm51]|uniref:peptide-methionine (S)-S-oxide reductase MsrA n=1 Tax=Nitrosomonas sp. Nm51 TaxID=133720 RepID=UPI0008C1CF4D|nr:peptide-methionine (S)-S-oxide reductase MsrA [Nitrosomonas sp. Nm51]SEQ89408.1 peptide-methionine (S)-S-oxide reductase [Nitrosomonas sp. Nm51]